MLLAEQSLATLIVGEHPCTCGKTHSTSLKYLKVGAGVIRHLPDALKALNARKPFIICDVNTKAAAWSPVKDVLETHSIPWVLYMLENPRPEPDEHTVGAITMAFDPTCDVIIALGSGVINDCCKVLAHTAGLRSLSICTAPSMDGYTSNSSSMIRDRIKVTLYNDCPGAVLADTDIMKEAPMHMLHAGLGDMLAKYISICEWRLSHAIIDEYYCENIAGLVRASLAKVVKAAPGLVKRDAAAVEAVAEGLLLSGLAMDFAEVSRPASGLEHYFSHLWEMMALERGTASELHGIQVGVGTILTLRLFEKIKKIVPDRAKAEQFIATFTNSKWEEQTRSIFGSAADTVIRQEHEQFHKNDPARHAVRLTRILSIWPDLLRIIDEELPSLADIESLAKSVGMPTEPADIGISREDTVRAFIASRDIRDKYLTSSLLWDLGLLYDISI